MNEKSNNQPNGKGDKSIIYAVGTLVTLVAMCAGIIGYKSRPMSYEQMYTKAKEGWGVVNCVGEDTISNFTRKNGNFRFRKESHSSRIGYGNHSIPAPGLVGILANRNVNSFEDFSHTLARESVDCQCAYSGYPIKQK